jgi:hypothetical protein
VTLIRHGENVEFKLDRGRPNSRWIFLIGPELSEFPDGNASKPAIYDSSFICVSSYDRPLPKKEENIEKNIDKRSGVGYHFLTERV